VGLEQDTVITDVSNQDIVPVRNDALFVLYARDEALKRKRFELKGERIQIGRDENVDIFLDDSGISRVHVELTRSNTAWLVHDANSKNGTLLNDQRLLAPTELKNGDRLKLGSIILKFLSGDDIEAAFAEEIFRSMVTDGLTGLANKDEFTRIFPNEVRRANRHRRPLSLVTFDIDFFKHLNDEHGHPAGDAVLSAVGKLVAGAIRADDLAARTGGEEFCVMAPETDLEGAVTLAEKLRLGIASHVEEYDRKELKITISAGCASLLPDESSESLMSRADQKLYEAKQGRNRVAG
jgi:two-component system cell cycle response regulator